MSFWRRPVLYPVGYTWYVFFCALDIMFTWAILAAGGSELNSVADWIIAHYRLRGLVLFKFLLVVLVIVICELAGRRRYELGAKLARWAVVLGGFPAAVGALQLLVIAIGWRWE
jgi:hypothetical protein